MAVDLAGFPSKRQHLHSVLSCGTRSSVGTRTVPVHISAIRSVQNGKVYYSKLLRRSFRDHHGRVQKKTIANLPPRRGHRSAQGAIRRPYPHRSLRPLSARPLAPPRLRPGRPRGLPPARPRPPRRLPSVYVIRTSLAARDLSCQNKRYRKSGGEHLRERNRERMRQKGNRHRATERRGRTAACQEGPGFNHRGRRHPMPMESCRPDPATPSGNLAVQGDPANRAAASIRPGLTSQEGPTAPRRSFHGAGRRSSRCSTRSLP